MQPPTYRPEAIWQARRAFFEQGQSAEGLVEDAVLRSWSRCNESGRSVHESVAFASVERQALRGLVEQHRALVEAARPELASLARSVADTGYAVLLTDARSQALLVDGAIASHSPALQLAFRPGVDLSESSIGTNAMCVAMSERQAVRVLGPEHFFAETQIFHCCAAPVFDPQGEVIGAVDVSRDMPGMLPSALWLAERCAQRIERRLFESLPSFVHLEIDVGEVPSAASTRAWLALGEDGQLIAASQAARQLMSLPPQETGLPFDRLFEGRFDTWLSRLRMRGAGVPLELRSGVVLRAQVLRRNVGPLVRPAVARTVSVGFAPLRPTYGDSRLDVAFDRAVRAFRAELPVLITGDTGCGKEVSARALHAAGPKAEGPFVALNCAAIPGELLAAELFGHTDGAFTGARRGGATGKIEAADGGTLFLDEIGDMPLALQAALLRVLDSKEVVPLGAIAARPVDVRVICATHRNLREGVVERWFREDLYYRINGHNMHLLPLRERSDFDAVLDALLEQLGGDPERIGEVVRDRLRLAPWPGNVRQLGHALRRAIAMAEPGAPIVWDDFGLDADGTVPPAVPHDPTSGLLEQAQDEAVARALAKAGGNVTEAARLLGMGRATLYRRLARRRVA